MCWNGAIYHIKSDQQVHVCLIMLEERLNAICDLHVVAMPARNYMHRYVVDSWYTPVWYQAIDGWIFPVTSAESPLINFFNAEPMPCSHMTVTWQFNNGGKSTLIQSSARTRVAFAGFVACKSERNIEKIRFFGFISFGSKSDVKSSHVHIQHIIRSTSQSSYRNPHISFSL